MGKEVKLCIDCKWCRLPEYEDADEMSLELRQDFSKCHHPARTSPPIINMVNGEVIERHRHNYCSTERRVDPGILEFIFGDRRCGTRGRLWEKKGE